MNCPYFGKSDDVTIFRVPTTAKLVSIFQADYK